MNRLKQSLVKPFLVIALLFAGSVQITFQYWKERKLKSCAKVQTMGIVYKAYLRTYRTSGMWVEYKYKVGDKEYNSDFNLGLDCDESLVRLLPQKRFTILYCSEKPSFSVPLIAPKTFMENKMMVPDSLTWLKAYFPVNEK